MLFDNITCAQASPLVIVTFDWRHMEEKAVKHYCLATGFSLEFQKQESGTPPFPKIGVPSEK